MPWASTSTPVEQSNSQTAGSIGATDSASIINARAPHLTQEFTIEL